MLAGMLIREFPFKTELTFNRTDHDPFNKIFLNKWIGEYDRQRRNDHGGKLDRSSRHIPDTQIACDDAHIAIGADDLHQNLLQRDKLLTAIQHSVEPGIPMNTAL